MGARGPQVTSRIMSKLQSRNTEPERILRSTLHRRSFRFLLHGRLPGRPDISIVPSPRGRLCRRGFFGVPGGGARIS